ncbi:ArsR/SmtB family transcription factor [Weissella hellenica]
MFYNMFMDKRLSEFFKLFSNVLRLKILKILDHNEQNVSSLVTLTGYSQSNISQQLKILKEADIISHHRHGKQIFYTLKDDHIHEIIVLASNHLEEKI